mmetsp:Transcript_26200/g.40065  ORF Transcript_26200/g.40065 Transcript_26200/m.40065 type:complete len:106 (-) Transcript_26200:19-336(-)
MSDAKLYVGNLSYNITDQDLLGAFAPCGEVTDCSVLTDHDTGTSKGFGFVTMSSAADAQQAIQALNGQELGGRSIMVKVAKPREARGGREDGGRGGRYRGGRGNY